MIISWKWLNDYVDLKMSHDDLTDRLTMSGLNHEGTETVGDDQAIDLEVTSNRADCLGHIGVAREVAALYDLALRIPDPQPPTGSESIHDACKVTIEAPESCFRYTARLIRGVKIGPSPQWLQDRLTTLGIGIVNNVVDATNYVMFECGQPLHAFDFKKIDPQTLVVRNGKDQETFEAIDHREYAITPNTCVIADAHQILALAGVMGGSDSEVSDTTQDVLIEAAYFEQLSVRTTARRLNLHSPSSFRFERDIDSEMIDWASRRCCELILETAGGTLADGVIDAGQKPTRPKPVTLRTAQLKRILGIDIPIDFIPKTLAALGLDIQKSDADQITVIPPSWRKDLTREVDLIEEVGRIYGYDQVPDNAPVPMAASHHPSADRVLDKVRQVMTSAGFDEAVTASLVPEPWSEAFSPWTDRAPMKTSQPMLGVLEKASQNIGAVDLLRRSLVPSLLEVRRINEYRSNDQIELFETAKVYLPTDDDRLPSQPTKLAAVSGRDYYALKGVIETVVDRIAPNATLRIEPTWSHPLLDKDRSCEMWLGKDRLLGYLGTVSSRGKKEFGLRTDATIFELDLAELESEAVLIVQHQNQSMYPSVSRDFNFIMDNEVHWSDLETTVRSAAGPLLEQVIYRETFRNESKDGKNKKRLLLTVVLRSDESTLTGDQVETVCQQIVRKCETAHAAKVLGA